MFSKVPVLRAANVGSRPRSVFQLREIVHSVEVAADPGGLKGAEGVSFAGVFRDHEAVGTGAKFEIDGIGETPFQQERIFSETERHRAVDECEKNRAQIVSGLRADPVPTSFSQVLALFPSRLLQHARERVGALRGFFAGTQPGKKGSVRPSLCGKYRGFEASQQIFGSCIVEQLFEADVFRLLEHF